MWPECDWDRRLLFTEHHQSHAASAFFPSPFEEALVLTMDGVGEWTTTSVAMGSGNQLEIIQEIQYPHSLGLLYSAFTYYTGFKVNSGEYKVMGLAPYGAPRYAQTILDHLIDLKKDGSFHLNLDYFDYCTGLTMTNGKFDELFGAPRGSPTNGSRSGIWTCGIGAGRTRRGGFADDVFAGLPDRSAQSLPRRGRGLELRHQRQTAADGRFQGLWIQPASGDAGGAVGAAMAAYYIHKGQPRHSSGWTG